VSWRSFALRLLGVGFYVAIVIIFFTLGGFWLGDKIDGKVARTAFTLVGATLGMVVVMGSIYLMLRPSLKGMPKDEGKDKEHD